MNYLQLTEGSIGVGIGILSLFLLIFWLSVTLYRLYKSRNTCKYYLHTYVDYSHIRSEILYTLQTVQNRDICLLILILLEIILVICLTFIIPVDSNVMIESYSGATPYYETFPECRNTSNAWVISFLLYTYTHPIHYVIYMCIFMVIISQLMLISFLNSYLAARYFKHKLQKKFFIKYFLLWILQFLILAITVTPQIQLFLPLAMSILLFANWVNLVVTSRKLCNYIKSIIKEIRLFESNPAALREHTTNLKRYRIAMGFLISSYLSFLIAMLALGALFLLEIIIAGDCYVGGVYGIKLDFDDNTGSNQHIHNVLYTISLSFSFFFFLLYAVLLFFPSLYLVVKYFLCWLYTCCTGRGNMRRMNNTLLEPLLYNPY